MVVVAHLFCWLLDLLGLEEGKKKRTIVWINQSTLKFNLIRFDSFTRTGINYIIRAKNTKNVKTDLFCYYYINRSKK